MISPWQVPPTSTAIVLLAVAFVISSCATVTGPPAAWSCRACAGKGVAHSPVATLSQPAAMCRACARLHGVQRGGIRQAARGEQPVNLDQYLWEGIWIPRYEGAGATRPTFFDSFERRLVRSIYIKVADADKGILCVAWVEGRDGDFKLAGSDVYVPWRGHWLLASLPWPDGEGYWWATGGDLPFRGMAGDLGSQRVCP